ncbi:MAG TPA: hypothetical protein VFL96_16260 [Acidobacteriaceae bacterium]|nr:hypothetical protein [Acidobacteriaceae bacterium]
MRDLARRLRLVLPDVSPGQVLALLFGAALLAASLPLLLEKAS